MALGEPAQAGRIGVMGGTFDPIHLAHLIAAESVRDGFHLHRVLFIPAGTPPHKTGRRVSPAARRLAMVRLAISSNPGFEVSTIETDRPGASYTVDTVRSLRREFGPETKLYFITGADAVLEILSWKDPFEIFNHCELVAVTRPGYDAVALDRMVATMAGSGGVVHRLAIPEVSISSSEIRKRVKERRSIRYLVPDAVGEYIWRTGLYQD